MNLQDDLGSYYISERGHLFTSSGKPVFSSVKRMHLEHPEEQVVTQPFYDSTDTANQSGLLTPPSLLKISLFFVADNLHLLESLVGFPEILGKFLFETASKRNKFKAAPELLNVFSKAYGRSILSELKISSHSFLEKVKNIYDGFHLLSKLDLDGCQVGYDHDILSLIAREFTRYVCFFTE